MGCAPSAFDLAVQNNESLKENLTQYSLLQFSDHDVRKLHNIFRGIDGYGGDIVELVDVLAHTDLPNKGFTAKIFSEFNDNYTGTIDFNEFVLALWNYCTLTKETLDTFVFELYDMDGAGELSSTQMLGMIEDIIGKTESKTNAAIKAVTAELLDFERRKVVFSLDRFRKFTKTHQAVLLPPVQILETLQKKTLGVVTWERLAEKRTKLSNGRYLSVKKFIALQGSGKPYTSLSTPGQSRDDESHPTDFSHDAESADVQGQSTVAIKTTATTTSFGLSDSSKESPCLTTSSKPSSTPGLTDSAKVRWTASLQSLVTAVSAKHTRRGKNNRVHASPKSFGASSGSGTNRNKNKSRRNSNSSDVDRIESGRVTPIPSNAAATITSTTTITTSSIINLNPDGEITPEPTARRRSVTFGETTEKAPVVAMATTPTTTSTATVSAGNVASGSPKNASTRGAFAHRDVSPRPSAGAGANAGFNATGISPKSSFANGSSARSTGASSSQRRGSKDIVIWSNDSEPANTSPKTAATSHSPKNANVNNNNKTTFGNATHSNASTPASTARAGSNGEGMPMVLFNDKMAFVPHDDAALAVRSRPAARRSVILPGAVEDAQGLTEYMHLHQRCRSLD